MRRRIKVLLGKLFSHLALASALATEYGIAAAALSVDPDATAGLPAHWRLMWSAMLLGAAFFGVGYAISALARRSSGTADLGIGTCLGPELVRFMGKVGYRDQRADPAILQLRCRLPCRTRQIATEGQWRFAGQQRFACAVAETASQMVQARGMIAPLSLRRAWYCLSGRRFDCLPQASDIVRFHSNIVSIGSFQPRYRAAGWVLPNSGSMAWRAP